MTDHRLWQSFLSYKSTFKTERVNFKRYNLMHFNSPFIIIHFLLQNWRNLRRGNFNELIVMIKLEIKSFIIMQPQIRSS